MNRPAPSFNRPTAAPSFRPQGGGGARPNIGSAGGARPNIGGGSARPNMPNMQRPPMNNFQRPNASPSLQPNAPTTRPNFPNQGGMLNPGGVRPNLPGSLIKPTQPINRPGAGGGGIQNPNFPNRPGMGGIGNRPGAGGGGIQNPNFPNRPDFGNRPGAGGGGIQNPIFPNRPDFGNRPGAGGGGIQNPNLPNRPDNGIFPNRPGQGGAGTQWPNRPDWGNRPGAGGGGTQWRPGDGNWTANRPNWPNRGDLGHWLNMPSDGRWNNNGIGNNNRWQNWNNVGNNYNTFVNNQASVVRNNFVGNNGYGNYGNLFTPNWYGGAYAGSYFNGYNTPTPYYWWNAATAANLTNWLSWSAPQPVYYNYGSNVDYSNGNVYVDQQPVATADNYIGQAMDLAQAGINALSTVAQTQQAAAAASQPVNDRPATQPAPAYSGPEWMPLGVFAVTEAEKADPTIMLQLAITKDGVIGGTYENTATHQTQNVAGKIDKASQRAAWSVSDGKTDLVMEAGIFNLTQPQTPVLVHWGKEKTQTWLMVRMDPPKESQK
jgi:hypothetical protein